MSPLVCWRVFRAVIACWALLCIADPGFVPDSMFAVGVAALDWHQYMFTLSRCTLLKGAAWLLACVLLPTGQY